MTAVRDELSLARLLVHLPVAAQLVARPLPRLVGLLGDDAALLRVVQEQARHLHVMHVGVHGVVDAGGLLSVGTAHGEVAVGHERVAAHDGELLDDLHGGAGLGGLIGGGESRIARADDQDLALLVERNLVGGEGGLGLVGGQGRGCKARDAHSGALHKRPACDVLHDVPLS